MFGAKASPKAARYAASSVMKGVHLYSEEDILRASGTERERRKWWNEKAQQLCENPQYDMTRAKAIDQNCSKGKKSFELGFLIQKTVF